MYLYSDKFSWKLCLLKCFFRVLERNSLNPLDLLVLERKRVSAIKEKSLTPLRFELMSSRQIRSLVL